MIRQVRGHAQTTHILVARAPIELRLRVVPLIAASEQHPTLSREQYYRVLEAWIRHPVQPRRNLSDENLQEAIANLASLCKLQNPRERPPPMLRQEAIRDYAPETIHFLIQVDLPGRRPDHLTSHKRQDRVEVILFEHLLDGLLQLPRPGDPAKDDFEYAEADSLVRSWTKSAARADTHMSPREQFTRRLAAWWAKGVTDWSKARRIAPLERPTSERENEELRRLSRDPPNRQRMSLKDQYTLLSDFSSNVPDKLTSETYASYCARILTWARKNIGNLILQEIEARECAIDNAVGMLADDPSTYTHQSPFVSKILSKISSTDQEFKEKAEVHRLEQVLGPELLLFTNYPQAAEPPLYAEGTLHERGIASLQRLLLRMRSYVAYPAPRSISAVAHLEQDSAYDGHQCEGEEMKQWTYRLVIQVSTPAETLDRAMRKLVQEGLRRVFTHFLEDLTKLLGDTVMNDIYDRMLRRCRVYSGQPIVLDDPSRSEIEIMAGPIITVDSFSSVVLEIKKFIGEQKHLLAAVEDPHSRGRSDENAARRRPRRFMGAMDEQDEASTSGTSRLDEYRSLLQANTEANLKSHALLAQNNVMSRENSAVIQRHSEVLNHSAPAPVNALEDMTDDQLYALANIPDEEKRKARWPLGRGGAPATAPTPARKDAGANVGRGGTEPRTTPPRDLDKPDPNAPFPFCMKRTNYHGLAADAKAGLLAATGIDGPDHPKWNTIDWKSQKNGCPCCGKEQCTPSHCLVLWSQSKEAEQRPEPYRLKMRSRLLWNIAKPMSMVELRNHLDTAATSTPPRLLAAIGELIHDPAVDSLCYRETEIGSAMEMASMDGGNSLYAMACKYGQQEEDRQQTSAAQ